MPKACLLPVECHPLRNSEPLWQASDISDADSAGFLDSLSWAVRSTECFEGLSFGAETRILWAERYGGFGVSHNGGGGRVLNIGAYQIKGAGKTGLTSSYSDQIHSYGGLSLKEAALETITSEMYGHILPFKPIKCFAILKTGNGTAYHRGPKRAICRIPGALLLRERAFRPAHLLRAEHYRDPMGGGVNADVARVRLACQEFAQHFSSSSDLVSYLGTFLRVSAIQLAAARSLRIVHGSMSPSNVDFNGRWLDTSTTTTCPYKEGATHRGTKQHLCTEPNFPKAIVDEVCYNLLKYCGLAINVRSLQGYYDEVYKKASVSYREAMFGGCITPTNGSKDAQSYELAIDSDSRSLDRTSNALTSFFNAFFEQRFHKYEAQSKAIIDLVYIRLLRMERLRDAISRESIERLIDTAIASNDNRALQSLIEACSHFSSWIFEDVKNDQVTLLSFDKVRIVITKLGFIIEYVEEVERSRYSLDELGSGLLFYLKGIAKCYDKWSIFNGRYIGNAYLREISYVLSR